jgi:hypothetical protein
MLEIPGLPDLYTFSALCFLSRLYDIIIAFLILVVFILLVNMKDIPSNKKIKGNEIDKENNALNRLAKCNNIFWGSLSSNPYAIELLKKRFEYEKELSVAEYLRLPFNHKINWVRISKNENAIELIKDRIEYEKSLGDEYKYQEIPYASNIYNKINWGNMTRNHNAIELLRERIKYEKTLSKEQYSNLRNRIDWIDSMGDEANKNAIILLKDLLIE